MIEYTPYPWSLERNKGLYYCSKGPVGTFSPLTQSGEIMLARDKVSVDTGSFIPGKYRVNPYSAHRETVDCEVISLYDTDPVSPPFCWLQRSSGNYLATGVYNWRDVTQPAGASSLADRALQKAYAKLAQPDLGLGEELGELAETISMIRSPFKSLRKFLMKDNRRNLNILKELLGFLKSGVYKGSSGKTALKTAADTWLEFRYGLMPLVYLIGDVVELVRKSERNGFNPDTIRSVRASVSDEYIEEVSAQSITVPAAYTRFHGTKEKKVSVNAYASVQYRQSKPKTTADKLGLSPRMWPETAWELTRLSFVVDWLFTIGPWIQSHRSKPEIEVLGNTVGVKFERNVAFKVHGYTSTYAGWPMRSFSTEPTWKYEEYYRTVNQSLPSLPLFTAGNTINLARKIDSAALIVQYVLGAIKRR